MAERAKGRSAAVCMAALRGRRGSLIGVVALAILSASLVIPTMFVIIAIFQDAIPNRQSVTAVALCGLAIVLRLVMEVATFSQRKLSARLAREAGGDLRLYLVTTVMQTPADAWIDQDHRRITTRLVQGTDRVDLMLFKLLSAVIPASISGAVVGVGLIWLSWQLALLGLVLSPFSILGQRAVQRRTALNTSVFRERAEDFGRDASFLLSHHSLTHHRGYEQQELTRIAATIDALSSSAARMHFSFSRMASAQAFSSAFIALALAGCGSVLVIEGITTAGNVVAFYVGAMLLAGSLNQATGALPDIIAGRQSLRQLDEPPFVATGSTSSGMVCTQVLPIELDAVSAGHGSAVLVTGVSMRIVPGAFMFIHGENGSGKSTLVETIVGLREPLSGRLTAAAGNYPSLDLESLRRRVGYVAQRAMLFQGTVGENLRYGRPSATDDEIEKVLEIVGADTWVRCLPAGSHTIIGDTGNRLSGGQAQWLAIARGLVGGPELLVLDEPGNHLAIGVLPRVLDQIRRACPHLAIIVVSHGLLEFASGESGVAHLSIDERTLVRIDSGSSVSH